MIKKWQNTYFEYLTHNNVARTQHADLWVKRTDDLIEFWNKMESGEIEQIYKSFPHFLSVQMDYYERINENYRRDARKKPVKVIKSEGGRYWL